MERRTFVQTLGAVVLSPAAIACAMPHGTPTPARKLNRVGVQLYTLRDAGKIDLDRTLADIAAIGFTEVEMLMSMRNFNHSPTEVRAMLDKHGLTAPSTHVGTETLDNVAAFVDEAKILGHKYLVLADVPSEGRQSLATFAAFADRLNRAGEVARKHDLWIAWHDEADDFKSFGGQQGYDALAARIDPSLVRLQLDIGNAAVGGRDPLDLMKRYGDRYYLFHIKDAPSIPAPHDVELGKGVVNFAAILALVKNLDDKYFYVEQETYPGSPLDSVKRDYAYISRLKF